MKLSIFALRVQGILVRCVPCSRKAPPTLPPAVCFISFHGTAGFRGKKDTTTMFFPHPNHTFDFLRLQIRPFNTQVKIKPNISRNRLPSHEKLTNPALPFSSASPGAGPNPLFPYLSFSCTWPRLYHPRKSSSIMALYSRTSSCTLLGNPPLYSRLFYP